MSNERDTSPVITQDKLLEYHNRLVYPFLNGISTKGDQAFVPCGKIEGFMRTTAPKGYLVCDGTEYLKSAYPSLAAVLGAVDTAQSTTNFAGSDANHFKVPDLRGEFLRGTGTNGHSNQGNGASVGTHQDATPVPKLILDYSQNALETYGEFILRNYDSYAEAGIGQGLHFNGTKLTGDWIKTQAKEILTRPTNTSVLYCIAYEDLYLTPRHTYSTTEQVVGTWIDGTPVYEKVVISIMPTGEETKEVLHGINNLKMVISLHGISFNSKNNSNRLLPYVGDAWQDEYKKQNLIAITSTAFYIRNYQVDLSSATAYITVRYTKTTDTAQS